MDKKKRGKAKGALKRATILGFALSAAMLPREARAYYALGVGLLIGTTVGGAITTAAGVYLTVKVVENSSNSGIEEVSALPVIEAALLSTRGDFAMHVDLLLTSPTAFAQLDRELAAGAGPAVDAMAIATDIDVATLVAAWERARDPVKPVRSAEEARATLTRFLKEIGPSLKVPAEVVADVSWQLIRERFDTSSNSARATALIANWLGITAADVGAAADVAVRSLGLDDSDSTRITLFKDPKPFLLALSTELDAKHKGVIDARILELTAPEVAASARTAKDSGG